jgi:predicted NAD/FAD-binding protein
VDNGTDVDIGFMVYNHTNYPNIGGVVKARGTRQDMSLLSSGSGQDGGIRRVQWTSRIVQLL